MVECGSANGRLPQGSGISVDSLGSILALRMGRSRIGFVTPDYTKWLRQ